MLDQRLVEQAVNSLLAIARFLDVAPCIAQQPQDVRVFKVRCRLTDWRDGSGHGRPDAIANRHTFPLGAGQRGQHGGGAQVAAAKFLLKRRVELGDVFLQRSSGVVGDEAVERFGRHFSRAAQQGRGGHAGEQKLVLRTVGNHLGCQLRHDRPRLVLLQSSVGVVINVVPALGV